MNNQFEKANGIKQANNKNFTDNASSMLKTNLHLF